MTREVRAVVDKYELDARRGKASHKAATDKIRSPLRTLTLEEAKAITHVQPSLHVVFYTRVDVSNYLLICRFQLRRNGQMVWSNLAYDRFDHDMRMWPYEDSVMEFFHHLHKGNNLVGNWSFEAGVCAIPSRIFKEVDLTKLPYEVLGILNWQVAAPKLVGQQIALNADGTLVAPLPANQINQNAVFNVDDI